ncbi:hypothetical protein [Streptomyces sp. enrichment culture]|uniref:hypothetical protein n=1 Tax=Streptomyces sp. enrichment culture TaxID=1795815 RepID=UPI003F56B8F0
MQETTDTPHNDGTVPVQWCSWHKGMAVARPVQIIEQGEGAGGTLYACRPCRITYKLDALPTWFAWEALFNHLGGDGTNRPCWPCNRFEPCPEGAVLWAALRQEQEADK